MRTFVRLSLFVFILCQSNAVFANFQQQSKSLPKCYIARERLDFSENGIYLYGDDGHAFRLDQIHVDNKGYFLFGGIFDFLFPKATVIARCNNCDAEYYNRSPQPCEKCDKSYGFYYTYISDGYDD